MIHECWIMFLPFGRNNGRGTGVMLSLCVERILMMNDISKTYSTILVSMLMVSSSNIMKKNMCRSSKVVVEPIPKNHLSPQLIKRPSTTIVHKDPQSYQLVKIDHLENGEEGQSEHS